MSLSPPGEGVSPCWPRLHPSPARNRGACVRYRGRLPACPGCGTVPYGSSVPGLCSQLCREPPDPPQEFFGGRGERADTWDGTRDDMTHGDIKLIVPFVSPQPGPVEGKGGGKANMLRGRNSATSADEQPHIGNYRLLKTIGKGNFAKVKLARHVLTGKEVSATVAWGQSSSCGCHRGVGTGSWSSPCGCHRGDGLLVFILRVPPWCENSSGLLVLFP